jgi:hypothetical protein
MRFAKVLRVEARSFLQRQDAFVALIIDAIGSIPVDLLPPGKLLLEDFRADDNSDGYLRFFAGADGQFTVLVEVASLRRSGWFGRRWYEVGANVGQPGLLHQAWALLQTGSGLDRYQQASEDEMPLEKLARAFAGREVIGNIPGGRICLQ